MDGFIAFCKHLSPLDEVASKDLAEKIKTRTVKKGDFLLKEGEVCKKLYFVNEGLAKTCFQKDGKEFIMNFFPENSMFTVINSFTQCTPSNYMVIALEPSIISYISKNDMEELSASHHCLETFFRKLTSLASSLMMKRISEMLEENASERYISFIKENKILSQRISLGDMASYLGISQVSLSRIRARK